MPTLYHGTSRATATVLAAGTINVAIGRGEFGRGFYTQSSSSNAHRRGYSRYGHNAAVLELIIDDPSYHALHFRRLSLNAAQRLDARLRTSGQTHTYTTNDDVIVGPLVAQPRIQQQKYQTQAAQNLLNGNLTQRTVI